MAQKICPKCSLGLIPDSSGRIGECKHHKEWFAIVEGAEQEAAQKNREAARQRRMRCPYCGELLTLSEDGRIGYCTCSKAQRKDEPWQHYFPVEEDSEQEAIDQTARAKDEYIRDLEKKRKIKLAFQIGTVAMAVLVVGLIVGLFVVKPYRAYQEANALLDRGAYLDAKAQYQNLNNYRDSQERMVLCDALNDLKNHQTDAALQKIDELTQKGDSATAKMFSEALLPMMHDWRAYGLSAEAMLALLQYRNKIDAQNALDYDRLNYDVHSALLPEDTILSAAEDLDGDGHEELLALLPGYTLGAYEMEPGGNTEVGLLPEKSAGYLIEFGDALFETRISDALACYQAAQEDLEASYSAETALKAELEAHLSDRFCEILGGWQTMGLSGEEALKLLRFTYAHGIDTRSVDSDTVYKNAALAACGANEISQYQFVELDGQSPYEELLLALSDGEIRYYALHEDWQRISSIQTQAKSPQITLYRLDKPVLLALSADRSVMSVSVYENGGFTLSLRMDHITAWESDADTFRFQRALKGSIERHASYSYSLTSSTARPVYTSIDWQQENYPYPVSSGDVLTRWLEARAYAIEPEMDALTAEDEFTRDGFSKTAMNRVQPPDDVDEIRFTAYDVQEGLALYEARYKSDGNEVCAYFSVLDEGGVWKVAGAANAFALDMEGKATASDLPLLTLNEACAGVLQKKGDTETYRFLLPEKSAVSLLWQAGDSGSANRPAFTLRLYDGGHSAQPIVSYELPLAANKQLSNPVYLLPGVYLVEVKALQNGESVPYSLTMQASHEQYIESEANDTADCASAMDVNQTYSASQTNENDVDFFAFHLDTPSKVRLQMLTKDEGQRASRYVMLLTDAQSGAVLANMQIPGNVQTAESANLYLDAGNYLLQIQAGRYHSGQTYQIAAQSETYADGEGETNDTLIEATALPVGSAVTGSFGFEGDVDCFTFALSHDSVIQPKLSFAPLESSSRAYALTVENGAQTLLTANIRGKETQKVLTPLALPAGSYFIRLQNPQYTPQDYTLSMAADEVFSAEIEPNDELAQATELTLAAPRTGVLSAEEDVDLFRLTLNEEKTTTLSFAFQPVSSNATAFTVRIEQNGSSLWSKNVGGASGGFAEQLQFPAGEYYVRVRALNWLGTPYTLTLQ